MKKALMVSTIIGFLASFERNDIAILQEMGYEVHVACDTSYYGSEERLKLLNDMKIIKHHIPFVRNPFSQKNIRAYQTLKSLIREEQFDIVHCHTPVGGVLGRLAAHRCNTAMIIYTVHGFHFYKGCPRKNRILFYPIEKWMSRFTDVLITINDEDYCVAKNKFHAKKTERIHGVGIDLNKFVSPIECRRHKRQELGISENDILLLSVGELNTDKNHIEVLKAMKVLSHKGFKYVIAGDGSLKSFLLEYITDNRIDDSVKLLGYRQDIPELLQAADIFVFPSLFEGVSVALMEAVASFLPIACSEVRGNVDTVITKESYFPTNNPSKLIAVLEHISSMSDQEKRIMEERNYCNLLKYSITEVQKEMISIYRLADEAVEKRGKNNENSSSWSTFG